MNRPDMEDLRMIEDSYARLTARRAADVHRGALSAIICLRATSALRTACGLPDLDVGHDDRGMGSTSGRADHWLRASDEIGDMDSARLVAGGSGRCVSELAAAILQRRALVAYIAARRRDGTASDGRGWKGAQLVHPAAFLIENATGVATQAGRPSSSTSRLLPGVRGACGTMQRRVFLDEGSPDVPWANRRPTRIGMEMHMPDVMVAALAGRRLRDIVSPNLPEHQDEAFSRLLVKSAARAGSKTNPRVDITLEPALRVPRGEMPEDASTQVELAWHAICATACRT